MVLGVWSLIWGSAVFYAGGFNPLLLGAVLTALILTMLQALSPFPKMPKPPAATAVDALGLMLLVWLLGTLPLSALPGVNMSVTLVVASLPLAYFLVRTQRRCRVPWRSIEVPLRTVGVCVAVLVVIEALIKRGRPVGTLEDSNALAALWNALFFPAYLALLSRWQEAKLLSQSERLLSFLLLLMLALAFSDSLGGKLCFFGGLFLATLLNGWRKLLSYKALGLTLAIFLGLTQLAAPIVSSRDAVNRLVDPESDQSITDRIEMVKSAWQIYLDHPLTGSGLGTYKILYPAVRSPNDITTSGDLAHNDYVQFLAEGGPLLLACLLALLGWTFWRMGLLIFKPAGTGLGESERLQTGGYAIALLCLFMHAAVNFIFYVLPLALITGVYLARVESVMPQRPVAWLTRLAASRWPRVGAAALLTFVVLTLGTQSLFVALSTESCSIRACREIRQKDTPVLALANFMIATQPSWLPARDYLIARLRDEAAKQTDPGERQKRLQLAAKEVIAMIQAAPAVHYPYALLADLLLEEPTIGESIPADLPQTAAALYATTLAKRPQDQVTRLALARQLEAAGKAREAFDLVNEDGMRWWKTAIVKDSERIAMLRYMIPRAVGFGLCADARGMAGSLGIFVPNSALAKAAAQISEDSDELAGCGLPEALPAE